MRCPGTFGKIDRADQYNPGVSAGRVAWVLWVRRTYAWDGTEYSEPWAYGGLRYGPAVEVYRKHLQPARRR